MLENPLIPRFFRGASRRVLGAGNGSENNASVREKITKNH